MLSGRGVLLASLASLASCVGATTVTTDATTAGALTSVAMVTEMRSGSTLLGNFLGSYGTLYFFEPCRFKSKAAACGQLAARLLSCDASLGDKLWKEVLAADRGFLAKRYDASSPAALIARLDGIPAALVDSHRTLRLVRDPRAVVNSRRHVGMCKSGAADCARKLCKSMALKDADAAAFAKRYDFATVYYEDLVAHPDVELPKLYSWLGLGELAKAHLEYAIAQLHGDSATQCKPGKLCARDGLAVANKWASELSQDEIRAVETDRRCAIVMRTHNYSCSSNTQSKSPRADNSKKKKKGRRRR